MGLTLPHSSWPMLKYFIYFSIVFISLGCKYDSTEFRNKMKAIEAALPNPFYEEEKGTFLDTRDATTYKWIRVKTGHKWMAENLNLFKLEGSKPSDTLSGRLYALSIAQIACPFGWHLATDDEWLSLLAAYGGLMFEIWVPSASGIDHVDGYGDYGDYRTSFKKLTYKDKGIGFDAIVKRTSRSSHVNFPQFTSFWSSKTEDVPYTPIYSFSMRDYKRFVESKSAPYR